MVANRTCGIVVGPEHDDDPWPTPAEAQLGKEFERALLEVLRASGLEVAYFTINRFAESAGAIARAPADIVYARRLELEASLIAMRTFGGNVEEAAALATELVSQPCKRRIAQIWSIVCFAGYCRRCGRPELGWPPLVAAFELAERELAGQKSWLARRAHFLGVLRSLWSSVSEEARRSLTPIPPDVG